MQFLLETSPLTQSHNVVQDLKIHLQRVFEEAFMWKKLGERRKIPFYNILLLFITYIIK